MSVGICALCGADLDACGDRTCDCARQPAALSQLQRAVARAADLASRGLDWRAALRVAASETRRTS